MISNNNTQLTPKTLFDEHLLEFDFPSMKIGVAEYEAGPTGCTVFYFPNGAVRTAVDVRGGSPGMIGNYELNDAICLCGGSSYGLEAATGVAAELFAMREYRTGWDDVAGVSGAVIYDYRYRSNSIYPDKKLGRAAIRAARAGVFPLGRHGAGAAASVGKDVDFAHKEWAGQGGAFRQIGVTKVAAFSIVNALGAIVDRNGKVVKGHLDSETGARYHSMDAIERRVKQNPARGNTTVTFVVTNQKMGMTALKHFARQVHASMARAIQPFQTMIDGDVLYAVTTDEVENPNLNEIALGVLASEAAWDAVLSVVDRQ